MFDLKAILAQLKQVPDISKLKAGDISKEVVSKHYIRYRFLELMRADIARVIADFENLPSADDILDLKPVTYGADEYSLDKLASRHFMTCVIERDEFNESFIDIIKLFKQATPIKDFIQVIHDGDREFLRRIIPDLHPFKDMRHISPCNGCHIYFENHRYMMLVNRADPTNYYVTVFDLGDFLSMMLKGKTNSTELGGIKIGEFNKVTLTKRYNLIASSLMHWQVIGDVFPIQHFISHQNVRRDPYTFDIAFETIDGDIYGFMAKDWQQLKLQFIDVPQKQTDIPSYACGGNPLASVGVSNQPSL